MAVSVESSGSVISILVHSQPCPSSPIHFMTTFHNSRNLDRKCLHGMCWNVPRCLDVMRGKQFEETINANQCPKHATGYFNRVSPRSIFGVNPITPSAQDFSVEAPVVITILPRHQRRCRSRRAPSSCLIPLCKVYCCREARASQSHLPLQICVREPNITVYVRPRI